MGASTHNLRASTAHPSARLAEARSEIQALRAELNAARRELHEAHEQQTATADVLKVISRSSFDLQTVLYTLTVSAASLCDAEMAAIVRPKDGAFYWVTSYGLPSTFLDWVRDLPFKPGRGSIVARVLFGGGVEHVPDVLADPEFAMGEAQKRGGYRTALGVPLLAERAPIAVILLLRREVHAFTEKEIGLVQTFADQAVIAIEIVRLFGEVQAKTRELTESLEYQTATSDVLNVISHSAFHLPTVLETLTASAARLCEAEIAGIDAEKDQRIITLRQSSTPRWISLNTLKLRLFHLVAAA